MKFPLESTAPNWVARRTMLCNNNECTGGSVVALYFSEKEFIDHVFDGAYWTTPSNGNGTGRTIRSTKMWESGEPSVRAINANGTLSLGGWYAYKQVCKMWNGSTGSACEPGFDSSFRDMYWTDNNKSTLTIWPNGGSVSTQFSSLDSAVAGISNTDKAKALNPSVLAQIVNNAWSRAASQPGYQGVPYSATQPVTADDVTAWSAENPSAQPTLGDLLVPAVEAGVSNVPISQTVVVGSPSTDPGTSDPNPTPGEVSNVNVVNTPTVRVEWGAPPNVGTPTLEATPTAQMILSPLLNLMPSLRNFVVPSHSSVCPKPSMTLFAKSVVMETHCTVLDSVRPTLFAVMAFVWLLVGALIILRA